MTPSPPRCRLYLITPPQIADQRRFCDDLRCAFDGGDVACLQIRLKVDGVPAMRDEVLRLYDAVAPIANAADVALVINDDPGLAAAAGADGVHIGQGDGSVAEARAELGPDAVIGVTCHGSIDLGFRAGEAGADYVAFGAFFPTSTKTASACAAPTVLRQWAETTLVPSVAIGGVTPQNCAPLIEAGADFLAVSAGVWRAAEGPGAAVRHFNDVIETTFRQNAQT